MKPIQQRQAVSIRILTSSVLGATLCAGSALGQAPQKIDVQSVPGTLHPDIKPAPGPRTQKEGRFPVDFSALSLEARQELDRAASLGPGEGSRSHPASASDRGKPPLVGERQVISSTTDSAARFVQFDTEVDGTLWAFGGNFKATFNPNGATFIPFLGSDAPQNYPLHFEIPSAEIDGRKLEANDRVQPYWNESTAVFDRGSFRELYDVRAGELEQLFVFEELPARGELVLRMNVDSELSPDSDEGRLIFEGPHGGVSYTHAIAFDATGRQVNVPTTFDAGGIVLRVPATFVQEAALPLTIDPIVTTFAPSASATFNDSNADLAWDDANSRWLVVWQRDYSGVDTDVWAEAFDEVGAPIAGTGGYLDFSTTAWRAPRVANVRADAQFLVVAEVEHAAYEIWGRTVEAGSGMYSLKFKVSQVGGDSRAPDVGGDSASFGPSYYMVVWERVTSLAIDHDILGQRVDPDGTLPGSPIGIDNTTGTYDKVPTISKSSGMLPFTTQRWSVVWQRQFGPGDWDIHGAQYQWNGVVAEPSFAMSLSTKDDRWPQASSPLDHQADDVDRQWLAVWERRDTDGISDILAASMRGAELGDIANLSELMVTGADEDQVQPAVDANRDHYAIFWSQRFNGSATDFDTHVASAYVAGTKIHVAEGPERLAASVHLEGKVQACSRYSGGTPSDWVGATWHRRTSTDSDIGAGIYECLDHYGPFIGTPYCGPAILNSSGHAAGIEASGSGHAGGNPLTLTAYNIPLHTFGYFIGSTQTQSALPPGTNGRVCVGDPLSRFNQPQDIKNSGISGKIEVLIDTLAIPLPTGGSMTLMTGQTFYFQGWFRDGASSNFTNGASVTFF